LKPSPLFNRCRSIISAPGVWRLPTFSINGSKFFAFDDDDVYEEIGRGVLSSSLSFFFDNEENFLDKNEENFFAKKPSSINFFAKKPSSAFFCKEAFFGLKEKLC
jgi:hypothetical protein